MRWIGVGWGVVEWIGILEYPVSRRAQRVYDNDNYY